MIEGCLNIEADRAFIGGRWMPARVTVSGRRVVRVERLKGTSPRHGGTTLVPALINAHVHSPMYYCFGLEDSSRFWDVEARMGPRDVWVFALQEAGRHVVMGTGVLVDKYGWPGILENVYRRLAVRAYIAPSVMTDCGPFRRSAAANLRRVVGRRNKNARISYLLGPHSPDACAPETLDFVRDVSRRLAIPVQMHVGQSRRELEEMIRRWQCCGGEYLWRRRMLGPAFQAVHAIFLSLEGRVHLRESGSWVVTCPTVAWEEDHYVAAEVRDDYPNVVLGSDTPLHGPATMWDEIRVLVKHARLDFERGLLLATERPARMLGLQAGDIAVGLLADLVLYRAGEDLWPTDPSQIEAVLIDGRVIARRGDLVDRRTARLLATTLPQARRRAADLTGVDVRRVIRRVGRVPWDHG